MVPCSTTIWHNHETRILISKLTKGVPLVTIKRATSILRCDYEEESANGADKLTSKRTLIPLADRDTNKHNKRYRAINTVGQNKEAAALRRITEDIPAYGPRKGSGLIIEYSSGAGR